MYIIIRYLVGALLFRCNFYIIILLLVVQINLQGVSNCIDWRAANQTQKLSAFSEELVMYIDASCSCDFPIRHIHQPDFVCSDNIPDQVTFRAYLVAFTDILTADQLVVIVNSFVMSTDTVQILGDMLQVNKQCPVVGTVLGCSPDTVPPGSSDSLLPLIIGCSVPVVFLLALVVVTTCVLVRRCHKR